MQKKLFHDLLGKYDMQSVSTIHYGKRILRNSTRNFRSIFIVLDDVDGFKEMKNIELLLDLDGVASGSLILITSRQRDT